MNDISQRIKLLRKENNLTQKQFAERILVSQSYLSRLENGSELPNDKLIKLIALEFDVPTNWLEDGSGPSRIGYEDSDYFDRAFESHFQDYLESELEEFANVTRNYNNGIVSFKIQAILAEMEKYLKENKNSPSVQVLIFEEMANIIIELMVQMKDVSHETSPESLNSKYWLCLQTMTHCLENIRDIIFNPDMYRYKD